MSSSFNITYFNELLHSDAFNSTMIEFYENVGLWTETVFNMAMVFVTSASLVLSNLIVEYHPVIIKHKNIMLFSSIVSLVIINLYYIARDVGRNVKKFNDNLLLNDIEYRLYIAERTIYNYEKKFAYIDTKMRKLDKKITMYE